MVNDKLKNVQITEYEWDDNRLFKVGEFEGPLDLLLFLIKSKKMDIMNLDLSKIADQYVSILMHDEDVDLDKASEYFLIASKLLSIKSRTILNQQLEEEEMIDSDEENLIESLMRYEKVKVASKEVSKIFNEVSLMDKIDNDLDSFLNSNKNVEDVLIKNNQDDLAQTMKRLIAQLTDEDVKLPQATIRRRKVSIEEIMDEILQAIKNGELYFSNLINGKDKIYIAIIFLAILELSSKKYIWIQETNQGDLAIQEKR